MYPLLILSVLLMLLQSGPVTACFDPTKTKCNGTTPRVDPETYFCMVRANLKYKLQSRVFVQFADKLLFKEYCRSKNVPTAKTLAVYEQTDYKKVDLDNFLPSYVLKSNKASGRVIVVKNNTVMGKKGGPLDADMKWMVINNSLSNWGRAHYSTERFYEFIKPRIFIEEFLDPLPDDIKVFVVHNQVDVIQINRGHGVNFYDADLNQLPYIKHYSYNFKGPSVYDVLKADPEKLARLHLVALSLASEVPLDLVRVDLFLIGDEFYGGEITLSSNAGNDFIQHVASKRDSMNGGSRTCPS